MAAIPASPNYSGRPTAVVVVNDDSNPFSRSDISPANRAVAVTPSDAAALPAGARALWIGGAGNIAVILSGDTVAVTLIGVPAGTLLPVQASKVMSTNTTASNVVALY